METSMLTQKRERFALLVASGESFVSAYKGAGYSFENMTPDTLKAEAWKVGHDPKVVARIRELQKVMLDKTALGPEWVLQRLARTYERADDEGNLAQCNRTLELLGRHFAMYTDKQEIKDDRPDHMARKPDFPGQKERDEERRELLDLGKIIEAAKKDTEVATALVDAERLLKEADGDGPFGEVLAELRAEDAIMDAMRAHTAQTN